MKVKRSVWKGLSSVCALVLALSLVLGMVLEGNASVIDTNLGTQSSVFVSENTSDDPLYDKFSPSADVLNADGTGNSHALIQKAIDLGREESAEGSVLLKNENGVLPLSSGANVTLFGIRSHMNLLGANMGVKAMGIYISLEQALSQNKTDFAHTIVHNTATGFDAAGLTIPEWKGDEFDFEGAGYSLNPTMIEIYENLNTNVYQHIELEGAAEVFDPGEPSVEEIAGVNPAYKDSFAQYGDAAIVALARPSAERTDYLPGGVVEGLGFEEPLALTKNERDAIELAKECSDKVIVLLSSSTSVEIGDLKNDPDVDAILWIGTPGCYGMLGVADILCGRTNPSGGLFDTFLTYNMSAPAMQNMGKMYYTNTAEVITRDKGVTGFNPGAYVIEAEGLYVGYRYYETRYYDCILGRGSASSPVGAWASDTEWKYDNEVTYAFGYGLSYTTFERTIEGEPEFRVSIDAATQIPDITATFQVKVTNTGSVAGKTPVQIYGQAPYTEGGLEKVAIQLLGFEKTDMIAPGESQTIPVTVDLQYIASYDMSYDNGDGTTGTYVLDPGDYWFATGNGVHLALNNIMAAQGTDAGLLSGESSSAAACMKHIDEDLISRTAFHISKTGAKISNHLPYSDWNYYQPGEVTYLTRADWAGTFPKTYDSMTLTNPQIINDLNGHLYTIQTNDDVSGITWGADNGIQFYQMYGTEYDDPKWQQLLDQITLKEAQYMATFGGPDIPGIASIGTVETYMCENAGNGVAVSLNASKDPGAPWNIPASDPNGNWHPEVFGNAPLGASSFNPDLMYRLGAFTGEESLFVGIPILWGPGLNTHRHPYNGRNGEYYSEDPILSGVAAMEFSIGALKYGLIAAPKHFAFNDQESERGGVSPYLTEQRAREVELRAYQYAFEATKYDTADYNAGMRGLMVSFSKVGAVECTTSVGLMTNILQDEWNFIGYAVTDIYDDTDLYGAVLAAGTTCFDTRGQSNLGTTVTLENCSLFSVQQDGSTVSEHLLEGDARLQNAVKDSVHKILFALTESNLMNRYNSTTRIESRMTWWRAAYYSLAAVSGILMVLFAALYVISARKTPAPIEKTSILYAAAAVLGIAGTVVMIASSMVSSANALGALPVLVLACAAAIVLCFAAWKVKMEYVGLFSGVLSVLLFVYSLGNMLNARVMLFAGLFSYNAGNMDGWRVFYVTVASTVLLLLSALMVIVASFFGTNEATKKS